MAGRTRSVVDDGLKGLLSVRTWWLLPGYVSRMVLEWSLEVRTWSTCLEVVLEWPGVAF